MQRRRRRKSTLHWYLLIIIVLFGLGIRLLLAPSEGYVGDVSLYKSWAHSAVEFGVGPSYTKQVDDAMLPNYPPFSLLIFAGVGHLYQTLVPSFDTSTQLFHFLIKMPSMIADALISIVLFLLLRWWKKSTTLGLIAALLYAVHPAALHNGAYWGQTDAIHSFFLLAGLFMYARKWFWVAGALVMLAFLSKAQAVAIAPLLLLLALRCGLRGFVEILGGAMITLCLVLLPYLMSGHGYAVINVYLHSVGFYSVASSAAYNFWWSLYGDGAGSVNDKALLPLLGITHRTFGMTLYFLSSGFALWVLRKKLLPSRENMGMILLAASFLMLAFFTWNTQMHERYLFPFVPLALPVAFLSARSALLYTGISLLFLMNIVGWLAATPIDRILFKTFPTLDVLIASLIVVSCILYGIFVYSQSKDPKEKPRKKLFISIRLR